MISLALDTLTRFSLTVGILVGISGGLAAVIRLGYRTIKAIDRQLDATIKNTEAIHNLSKRMDRMENRRKHKWKM